MKLTIKSLISDAQLFGNDVLALATSEVAAVAAEAATEVRASGYTTATAEFKGASAVGRVSESTVGSSHTLELQMTMNDWYTISHSLSFEASMDDWTLQCSPGPYRLRTQEPHWSSSNRL